MPTPVGHALGGMALGWSIAGSGPLRTSWRRAALFGTLGALADIDLLFHAHSTYTHSLGAALLAGIVTFAWSGAGANSVGSVSNAGAGRWARASMALACGAAYGSHVLLDWLGTDTTPPLGITALWPFSSAFYYSGIDLFPAVDRRYWLPGFWMRDLNAIAWELVVLLPITALVLWLRASPRQRTDHA